MSIYQLHIAELPCEVSCYDGVRLKHSNAVYERFQKPGQAETPVMNVEIRIRDESLSVPANARLLFESGQTWDIWQCDHERYIAFKRGPEPYLSHLMKVNAEWTRVEVLCDSKMIQEHQGERLLINPMQYPLDQILFFHLLPLQDGLLVHAAGMKINDRGYLFPGRSGAGKSTLMRYLAPHQDIGLLSDDRVVARQCEDGWWAYGTPWPGEAGVAENARAPLKGLFFLKHDTVHQIVKLNRQEALERLLPVISIPWYDRQRVDRSLALCETLLNTIPAYELRFAPDREVAQVLKEFLSMSSCWQGDKR